MWHYLPFHVNFKFCLVPNSGFLIFQIVKLRYYAWFLFYIFANWSKKEWINSPCGKSAGRIGWVEMVLLRRIELPAPSLPRTCSTTELQQHPVKVGSYYNRFFSLSRLFFNFQENSGKYCGNRRNIKPSPCSFFIARRVRFVYFPHLNSHILTQR